MNALKKDVGLKLVSLLIAITLWAYVKSITLANTQRTIEFTLYPSGLDTSSLVVTHRPNSIKVTAEGSPEDIQRLDKFKASQFIAYIDLSAATAGTSPYRVTLQRDGTRDSGITYSRPERLPRVPGRWRPHRCLRP